MPPLRNKLVLCTLAFIMIMSVTGLPNCPEDYFFDHGTDKCENCWDICDSAQIQRTVETCMQLCPAYARKIGLVLDTPSVNDPKEPSSASSNQFPTGAKVGIGVAAALVALCFIVLAVFKRGSFRKLWKLAPSTPTPVVRTPEIVSLVPNVGTGEPEVVAEGETGDCAQARDGLLRTVHGQETSDWWNEKHELAVLGDSRGSLLSEEVEPKTFHNQGAPRTTPPQVASQG